MLHELDQQVKKAALKINAAKTKFMRSDGLRGSNLRLNDNPVEEVESFVNLGQTMKMCHSREEEPNRRRKSHYVALNSLKEILTKLNDPAMRAHLLKSTVLSSVIYECETWSLTKKEEQRLAVTERAMVAEGYAKDGEIL